MEQSKMQLVHFVDTGKGQFLLTQESYKDFPVDTIKKEVSQLLLPEQLLEFMSSDWQTVKKKISEIINGEK